jgi:hypothetical protein
MIIGGRYVSRDIDGNDLTGENSSAICSSPAKQ